jgi:hypothetical protein
MGLGINIFKDGEEPQVKPDEEYPEWLQALAHPDLTLTELRAMDVRTMTERQKRRMYKLHKRAKIRTQNEIARVAEI